MLRLYNGQWVDRNCRLITLGNVSILNISSFCILRLFVNIACDTKHRNQRCRWLKWGWISNKYAIETRFHYSRVGMSFICENRWKSLALDFHPRNRTARGINLYLQTSGHQMLPIEQWPISGLDPKAGIHPRSEPSLESLQASPDRFVTNITEASKLRDFRPHRFTSISVCYQFGVTQCNNVVVCSMSSNFVLTRKFNTLFRHYRT